MGTVLDKKYDILYFDKDKGKVCIKDDCMTFKDVSVLLRRDKSNGKKFFNKCITYCYYMNHLDSPIRHQPLSIKKKNILLINEGELSSFDEKNAYYINFEKWFLENHLSVLEIRFNKLIKDIDDLIEHMSDIPLYKKVKENIEITTTECNDGEEIAITKNIKINQIVDNSKEKTQAISNIKSLDELKEMLIKKIKTEYNKKDKGNRRIFDR